MPTDRAKGTSQLTNLHNINRCKTVMERSFIAGIKPLMDELQAIAASYCIWRNGNLHQASVFTRWTNDDNQIKVTTTTKQKTLIRAYNIEINNISSQSVSQHVSHETLDRMKSLCGGLLNIWRIIFFFFFKENLFETLAY